MGKKPSDVRLEIEALRDDTGWLVDELNSRLKEATDLRAQIRRHPLITAGAGVALLGGLVLVGYLAFGKTAHKKQTGGLFTPVIADLERRQTMQTIPQPQERSEEAVFKRVLYAMMTAGMMALATFLARRMVDTFWVRTMQEQPPQD